MGTVSHRFADFDAFIKSASNMSELAKTCELIVAEMDSRVVGVVGYGPPNQLKQSAFDPAWAVVRMLSTHPDARGRGVGRLLTERVQTSRPAQSSQHTCFNDNENQRGSPEEVTVRVLHCNSSLGNCPQN